MARRQRRLFVFGPLVLMLALGLLHVNRLIQDASRRDVVLSSKQAIIKSNISGTILEETASNSTNASHDLHSSLVTPKTEDENPKVTIDPNNDTTIIILSSLIPSHPSLHILNQTMTSLYEYLDGLFPPAAAHPPAMIVAVDGLRSNATADDVRRWTTYLANVQRAYTNTIPRFQMVASRKHLHITGNLRQAMLRVQTRYVYIVEHDFAFCQHVYHTALIRTFADYYPQEIQMVRFNKRPNLPVGKDRPPCWNAPSAVQNNVHGIQLTKTKLWSNNNHFTTKEYYLRIFDIFAQEFPKDPYKRPTEYHMMRLAKRNCTEWGPFLYGAVGDGPFLKHLDGRGTTNGTDDSRRNSISSIRVR